MFGKDQEASLLAYILKSPDILHDYKDKLVKEHFRYSPARFLFERFKDKYHQHRLLPTLEECQELIQRHPKFQKENSVVQTAVLNYMEDVYSREVTPITGEFLGSFIIRQELIDLDDKLQTIKDTQDYDTLDKTIGEVKDRIQHLQDILHKKHKKGLSFPFDQDSVESFGRFMESSSGEAISSGFDEFDARSRGGYRRGDVVMLSGQSGVGKTAFLVSSAVNFVRSGHRVVYFALDNTERDIKERVYASFTGVPIEELTLNEYVDRIAILAPSIGTRMVIQHLPSKSVNTIDLRNILKDIQKELWLRNPDDTTIDVVIIDYGDKVNASRNYKDIWYMLGELFDEFVGLAQSENQLWVVATQQNEEGKEYGARSKRFAVAHNLALDQTVSEYHERKLRLKVMKNRYGPTHFQLALNINYENQRISQCDNTIIPICDSVPASNAVSGKGSIRNKKGNTDENFG